MRLTWKLLLLFKQLLTRGSYMKISKVIALGAAVLDKIIFNNLIEIHKVIAVFSLHKYLDLHLIITSPKSSKSVGEIFFTGG